MLRRSRQRHSRGFGFPSRISRLTRHCLARCRNGSIVHMHSAPCLPRLQIQGPPEICHILRCTVATSSDHDCLALVSLGEAFPNAGTSRAYALHLQVPHHIKDTEGIPLSGSQTASFWCPNTATKELTEIVSLFGRNLGTVHEFGGGQLVNASSGLDASRVVTSVLRFFLSASLSPCVISWSYQLSGPSCTLKWGRPSLVKSVGAFQCQPIPCSTL